MKQWKKVLSISLALAVGIMSFTACGQKAGTSGTGSETTGGTGGSGKAGNKGGTLVVWTFTDEIKGMIEDYYLKDYPDLPYKVDIQVTPTEQFPAKLDPALAAGKDAPDVFALEAAFVKKYVDSKYTANLADLGLEEKAKSSIVPYVLDVARDTKGVLKGISWQATPGAFFYRRSIAEQYLGVSTPEEVQPYVKDFDTFLETAKKLKEASNGKVAAISAMGDLSNVFYAARDKGWVVDGNLVIDPKIDELLEAAKVYEQEGLTQKATQWQETWFAGMQGDDVFGYFLPTWGLHYVLKTNSTNAETSKSTEGDWGMVQGPSGYSWGGTWIAAREGTQMKQAAADLIEYLTMNEDFLTRWAKDTGDFLSHTKVVNSVKDDYSEPFLAGQNHYAAFAPMAEAVDATIITYADQDIQNLFNEQMTAYANGEKDKASAINDFKAAVKNAFPDLNVQ